MPPPIRIRFRRSGGFAGIPLTAATTADQLAGDHAAQVRRLLTEAEAPGRHPVPAAAGGADMFRYELDLDDGQQRRSLAWNETQVPEEIRPLLGTLTSLARPG